MERDPKTIKSAQFIDVYFPTIDGVVQTVNNYARVMNEISYACVVAPTEDKKYDDSVFSYDVLRSDSFKIPFWEYSFSTPAIDFELRKALKSRNLDIFHIHSPFLVGGYAVSLAKNLDLPVVATFHSKYYEDTLRLTKSTVLAKTVTKGIVRLYNKVDSVWAVSEGTADTLRSYGYEGDVFVINNGTAFKAPDNVDELKAKARAKYNIPADKKILLFVGHQIWQKNLKLVLDTFKSVTTVSDDYRLVIVGNGYNEESIKKYAEELNFKDGEAMFLGKISDRDMLSGVFACADLFFFPSVYDNAPLVVREAAAMGVPSLLTEGSNAAETVKKNISGYTAAENVEAMTDEILNIFADPERHKAVSLEAARTIPIPWEELMPKVYEKYAEIIDKKQFSVKKKNIFRK